MAMGRTSQAVARWACTTVATLLLLVWIVSGWYGLSWTSERGVTGLTVIGGRFVVHHWKPHSRKQVWYRWDISKTGSAPKFWWWLSANKEAIGGPLWIPTLLAGGGAAAFWSAALRQPSRPPG